MPANLNQTAVATFLRTLWSKDAIDERKAALFMFPRIANRTGEFDRAKTVRVPLRTLQKAQKLGANLEYSPQAPTDTYSEITINDGDEVSLRIPDDVNILADRDMAKFYSKNFGYSLAKRLDTEVIYKFASGSFSNAPGGTVADLDLAYLKAAVATLDTSKVPTDERSGLLYISQYWNMFNEPTVTNANQIGMGKSPNQTAELPPLLGIEWLKSTQAYIGDDYSSYATYKYNMVWHKTAMAGALVHKVEVTGPKDVTGQLAKDWIGWQMYGLKAERLDHALLMPTTN